MLALLPTFHSHDGVPTLEPSQLTAKPLLFSLPHGVCLAGVSGGPSPGSTHPPLGDKKDSSFSFLKCRGSPFGLGVSAAQASAPPAGPAQALGLEALRPCSPPASHLPLPSCHILSQEPFEGSWGRSVFHATCLSTEDFVLAVRDC